MATAGRQALTRTPDWGGASVVFRGLVLPPGSPPYVLNIFTSTLGGYVNNIIDLRASSPTRLGVRV
ncbi:MAG TPA: hypothetical protein PKV78_13260 [Methanoculleus thermophilus]|nr:hypothetical protein [Methanoculleus thermophilus]